MIRPHSQAIRAAALFAALCLPGFAAAPAIASSEDEPALPVPPLPAAADATAPTIGLDELTPGQRGYGLTVFAGNRPERFEAEVVGVMRNVSPEVSYILARLSGHGLEQSGVAGGMSGSPVYFDGRLAGAVAFSWAFSNEAIAGITPIAAMRRIPADLPPPAPPGTRPEPIPVAAGPGWSDSASPPPSPVSALDLATRRLPEDLLERELARLVPPLAGGAASGLQWSAAGFGAGTEGLLRRSLGTVAPVGQAPPEAVGALVPGGTLSAVLIDGDLKLAATGTVTDVTGDGVLGFGHSFLGLGPLTVPMAGAEVVTLLSSRQSSFKIANVGPVVGAIEQDRQSGVRGRLGAVAPTVPLTLTVDGPERRRFEMRLASVPQLTPTLIAVATLGGLEAASYASGVQGLDLEARFRLDGGEELSLAQSLDGDGAGGRAAVLLLAYSAFLLQNEMAEVGLDGVEIEIQQSRTPRTANLVGAHAERAVVRPGEPLTLHLDFTAYRGEPFRRALELTIPPSLPEGRYHLLVGDGVSVDAARLAVERAEPVTLRQALALLRSMHSNRELVVLGVRRAPGLSVAGEVMPQLPGTVRSIWSAADPGGAVPLRLAVAQTESLSMPVPVAGILRVDLTVERREPLTAGGVGAAPAVEPIAGGDGGDGDDGDPGVAEGSPAEGGAGPAGDDPASGDPAATGTRGGEGLR